MWVRLLSVVCGKSSYSAICSHRIQDTFRLPEKFKWKRQRVILVAYLLFNFFFMFNWTVHWQEANLSGSVGILIIMPFERELEQRKKVVFFTCVSSIHIKILCRNSNQNSQNISFKKLTHLITEPVASLVYSGKLDLGDLVVFSSCPSRLKAEKFHKF